MLSLSLLLAILSADPQALANQAVRGDANAIRSLRAMGQPGVDALMAVRDDSRAFHAAIDAVCRQRDCAWSGLYWHTDLETAMRVARQTKRPILSLRLLGNLDEELSCANSRYFRTLLYPNRAIGAYLRANYVLHWQPVRSAPVITIDFGGGRRMQRTITGNSIHYILDENGKPLDAIPGLYAPPVFLALLREGVALHREAAKRPDAIADSHAKALLSSSAGATGDARSAVLPARASGNLAVTKALGESPMLDRIAFGALTRSAMRDLGPTTIDENAIALIRAKRAASPDASMRSEESLRQVLEALERSLAADTKINEERLHRTLHEWFAREEVTTVDALNERVYEELFLAPNGDPWMGLVSETAFTGLAGEGLTATIRP
jgi:hypothetical protein